MYGYNRIMKSSGFTFLEILIAMSLFVTVAVGFSHIYNAVLDASSRARQDVIAANLAHGLLSEITAKDFVDPQFPLDTALGPNGAETRHGGAGNAFDDVDDYKNFVENPPVTIGGLVMNGAGGTPDFSAFTRRVDVEYATVGWNTVDSDPGPTNYKMIAVTVTGPCRTVVADAIKGNEAN